MARNAFTRMLKLQRKEKESPELTQILQFNEIHKWTLSFGHSHAMMTVNAFFVDDDAGFTVFSSISFTQFRVFREICLRAL